MTRPRLVYLVTEDWYFVSHRLKLAEAARDKGFDVTVVTNVARHGDIIRKAGLNLVALDLDRSGTNPLADASTVRKIVGLYRRLRPDIVHHVAMKPVLYGSIAARIARVPGIVNALMGLGYVFTSEHLKAKTLRPVIAAALRQATSSANSRVIVQNRDDAQQLVAQRLARPEQLRVIRGSGVDPDEYVPTPLPAGRPRVVLPARLLRDKGVIEFVEAARLLKRQGVDAEFVLAGAPDRVNPASLTEADINAWVREGVVTALGWRDDMPAVLAGATIVCLPSYREGLPKALLEAAAVARPIVATDVPGCREIVVPGENGWLVPPRDSVALAQALRQALGDPGLCAKYGARGREMIETRFAAKMVIGETLAVYDELCPLPPQNL
jgi:glycosyltransferase involved in cell wall biosynthesis